jgi:hypothetical protein
MVQNSRGIRIIICIDWRTVLLGSCVKKELGKYETIVPSCWNIKHILSLWLAQIKLVFGRRIPIKAYVI